MTLESTHPRPLTLFGLLAVLVTLLTFASPAVGLAIEDVGATATPPPDDRYFGALPWEVADDVEEMQVHRVVDGDTLQLTYPGDDYYYATRIIGIQAPETDGPYTDEECYGLEATVFLRDLLPAGSTVMVQRDISDEDRNGRRLRHVFVIDLDTKDAYLLSEVLVLGGFAQARQYAPDDLYEDVLAEAQITARSANAGLWDACSR